MKVSEVQAGFVHEQPGVAEVPLWLAAHVDYANRDVMATALRGLTPDWEGFAPPSAEPPTGRAPVTLILEMVGGDLPADSSLLFHQGR